MNTDAAPFPPGASSSIHLDPVTLAVIQGALSNIQLEMTQTLQNTGRSSVVTLARDYSNSIFDAGCEMVLQGQDIPIHLGSLLFAVKAVAHSFAHDIHPGDVFFHNDPAQGGSHLPDMCMYKPVFVHGAIAFWTVSKVHVVDAGGPVPTSYNIEARESFAEGLRIPALRIIDSDVERKDVWAFILANVRTPENQLGDMRAQLGALRVGERRLLELCERYGLDALRMACDELKNLADRQMRRLIATVPDGTTTARSIVEDPGHGRGEIDIEVEATVLGDTLTLRISSCDQIPYYINSYHANTVSAAYIGLLMWAQLPPPYNEGLYRAITVDPGPAGTLTNAVMPAPSVNSTTTPTEAITDAVKDALTRAAPNRPIGAWGHSFGFSIAGMDPRRHKPYVSYMLAPIISGAGAVDGVMDGWNVNGPGNCLGAASGGDMELTEYLYPLIVHEYSIRTDSGGAGEWRGGCGAKLVIEPLAPMQVVAWGEGTKYPSAGHRGAQNQLIDRKVALGIIERADGSSEEIRQNRLFDLAPGDRYTSVNPGGGGCGDPLDRDPARVIDDVRNWKVTSEAARREYGVVVDRRTLTLDATETARCRKAMRQDRLRGAS